MASPEEQAQQQAGVAIPIPQDAPSLIQLIPYGEHHAPNGNFIYDEEAKKSILEKSRAHRNDYVIDYEHQSLGKEKAPAAGWITELIDKGKEGLWGKVNWTKKGKEYIQAREYRYVSPVFLVKKADNRISEFINLALTNNPQIDGMVPLINTRNITTKQEKQMTDIANLLGLGSSATQEEIIAAIRELIAQRDKENREKSKQGNADNTETSVNKRICAALNLQENAPLPEITAEIFTLKRSGEHHEEIKQELITLKKTMAKQNAQREVAVAMKSGKITPAQREWATRYATEDPEGFQLFVSKATPVIPLEEIPEYQVETTSDPVQEEVFKALGIKPKKANV